MNNLDPEVAERPDDLVVYGGTGRAARSWEAYERILSVLRASGVEGPGPDRYLSPEIETAVSLVQSGAVLAAVESKIGELQ